MKPALFLDRDGILNSVVKRGDTISSPWNFEEFAVLPGAAALVSAARAAGYVVVVVTNQPDVARGNLAEDEMRAMHASLQRVLEPDAIEACTSGDDNDPRRKPNPGMLLDAARRLDLDLASSIIIGDSAKDIAAGRAAGVRTVLLETAYNTAAHGTADVNLGHYEDLAEFILQQRISP